MNIPPDQYWLWFVIGMVLLVAIFWAIVFLALA